MELSFPKAEKIDLTLVGVAYFGGGFRWSHEPVPEGTLLVMVLLSTSRARQSEARYEKFFDAYDSSKLVALGAKFQELAGFNRAEWQIQVRCNWTRLETFLGQVVQILTCHTEEIRRIENMLNGRR